ncbi:MAG: TonB-dependent receptor [Candidatus Zhuqueibacterota bacterium]
MKKNRISCCVLLTILFAQISLGADFTVRGRVTDSQTDAPLPKANVMIEGTSLGTISDDAGRFTLKIPNPGTYVLQVKYIGYKKYRQSLNFSSDRIVEVNIALVPTVISSQGVTVTAKADVNRAMERKTPVAFTKLDVVEIQRNYTTGDLPELIQDVPGVWTSSAGLGESEIIVRGFTSDKVRFMINDIPMNEPEDNQVYWSNWASLSSTAQSIEVHRGPGYSLYGPAAFGGSVHIETMGVALVPGSIFRVSSGVFQRLGISNGMNAGRVFNPEVPGEMTEATNAINYTYSLRMNSGPLMKGKLNVCAFLEYKTGDSYLYGTTYDGYSFGLEAESLLRQHRLRFSFFISPQSHNQAFALQDIDLLDSIGREYNRKDHSYQENYYSKPFWSLKHEWTISDKQILVSSVYYTIGKGADQTLVNDVFDVNTGAVEFQPVNTGTTLQAFGKHAAFLYEKFGLWCTDFMPLNEDWSLSDPYNQNSYKQTLVGRSGVNLFTENHDHSWQRRNRRDHNQLGIYSYYKRDIGAKIQVIAGGEGRVWRGHREAEIWYLKFGPGITFRGLDVHNIVGENVQTDQLQSLYNYNTEVDNLSVFSRVNLNPFEDFTLQAGGQFAFTNMKVIENPIRFLDIGSFLFFKDSYRTSADQINEDGSLKFTDGDYKRSFNFFTPWLGCNYNITETMNAFSNYATSKKEPAILDWYDFAEGPMLAEANGRKLQPETATSLEVGVGYKTLLLESKLNCYYTRYSDKIESVIDINEQRRTMNAGRAVFQGFEWEFKGKMMDFDFSGTATISRNRWISMNVDSIFGAAATDVKGKVVPFAPERMFSACFGYRFEPFPSHNYHFAFRLNYWDEYYGTYTNEHIDAKGYVKKAKLPYFLDISGQLSFTKIMKKVDLTFRLDVNNLLNRRDNFMRAQYTIDYTRNDILAGKYNWYVLQAPLFNVFLTGEVAIH